MEQNDTARRRRQQLYRRNRANQGSALALLLLAVLLIFNLANLFAKDREYSSQENRKLAQKPALSWSSLTDGTYFADMESYLADQFVWRDFWISLQLKFAKLMGQSVSNGVILGEDGYLMEQPAAPKEDALARNLDAIDSFAAEHPSVSMYMAVVPNAASILKDKLPKNIPLRDQQADLQSIQKTLHHVDFLDVTDTFLTHADEALFYRTDHHWTSLGAYYAFQTMAPQLGITQTVSDYDIYPVTTTFEGTLASRSGQHSERDRIDVYVPHSTVQYYVSYEDTAQTSASLYDSACLEQKDKYTVFFGGNHPRVDVVTTANTGRNLLIFKDSYANCFVQFLTPYYDHIILIDARYYYGNAEKLLNQQKITDVLYLYNANTFLEDASLADVLSAE